jgi:hypothetical protein
MWWKKNLENYMCAIFFPLPQSFLFLDQPQIQKTLGAAWAWKKKIANKNFFTREEHILRMSKINF